MTKNMGMNKAESPIAPWISLLDESNGMQLGFKGQWQGNERANCSLVGVALYWERKTTLRNTELAVHLRKRTFKRYQGSF